MKLCLSSLFLPSMPLLDESGFIFLFLIFCNCAQKYHYTWGNISSLTAFTHNDQKDKCKLTQAKSSRHLHIDDMRLNRLKYLTILLLPTNQQKSLSATFIGHLPRINHPDSTYFLALWVTLYVDYSLGSWPGQQGRDKQTE